jgi:hypothetical protein
MSHNFLKKRIASDRMKTKSLQLLDGKLWWGLAESRRCLIDGFGSSVSSSFSRELLNPYSLNPSQQQHCNPNPKEKK